MNAFKPWTLAATAGTCLALALPSTGFWPLLLLFPGLLLETLRGRDGARRIGVLGFVAGWVHWMITVHWVVPVMNHYGGLPFGAAVLCLVLMAAILGLSWAVVALMVAKLPPRLRVLAFPAAWATVEAARQIPPYSFPWNPTAAAFWESPIYLASLPVWGATGLGWAVVLLGAGLWATLRRATRVVGLIAIVSSCCLALTISATAPLFTPSGPSVGLAALQPGTSLEEKWDPNQWQDIVDNVWELSRPAAMRDVKVLIWPESAVPFRLDIDSTYQRWVVALAEEIDASIVLNSVASLPDGEATNSAFVVSPHGIRKDRYDKNNLVPFGEYVPTWAQLAFTESLVREVGSFTPGRENSPIDAGHLSIGIAICYEIVFADHIAEQTRNGAEVLATLTNDGWYGFSSAPAQHFSQAILRAVENRRWVVRAALTGISGMIDPYGNARTLDLGETGYLDGMVEPSRALTPRARWGDWWAWVCLAMLAAVHICSWRRKGHGTTI